MKLLLNNKTSFHSLGRFSPVKIAMLSLLIASLFSASYLSADTRYRVKSLDSVKRIVAKKYPNRSLSQEQLMIEIYFRNPKAFIRKDINRLKRGYRLRLPSEDNIQAISHSEAVSILKRGTKHYQSNTFTATPSASSSNVGNAATELLSEFELSGEDLDILGAGRLEKDVEVFVDDHHQEPAQVEEEPRVVEPISQQPARQSTRPSTRPSKTVTQERTKRRNNRRAEKAANKNKKELFSSRKQLTVAKKQLRIIEEERQNLKEQLEKLTKEKRVSDAQLNDIDTKLQKSIKLSTQLKSDLDANIDRANDVQENVEPKKPEELSAEKTQKLEERNTFFQQKLQEARSELAENTRENITLERQLNALKNKSNKEGGISKSVLPTSTESLPTRLPEKEGVNSVAGDIGVAKHSGQSLDGAAISSNQGMGKFLWLLPLLALFGGLWLVLRRFLGAKHAITNKGNTFATTAFGSDDGFDDEYEEVSLETSIKLDVARAYIEAGDSQSAREMLEEVIAEGNDEQQQEAQTILKDYKLSA